MASIDIHPDQLVVRLTRGEKFAALRGDLRVPTAAIRAARVVEDPLHAVRGLRAPGLELPGRRRVGTWRARGTRALVVASRGQRGVRLEIAPSPVAPYDVVVVGLAEPERCLARLAEAGVPVQPSRQLRLRSGGLVLAGTLATPAGPGPHPAALLLTGSGPLDRDTNHRRMRLDVMRQLAEALASAGIASLRFDKRGVGTSGGDFWTAGLRDNVDDAAAALQALREAPEVDPARVVLLGHSEGALIAVEVATTGPAGVTGLVLLAAPAGPAAEVLAYQARAIVPTLPGPVRLALRLLRIDPRTQQQKRLAKLRASTSDTTGFGPTRVNAKWWREFLEHDPRLALRRVAVPTLVVTGSKDLQVDPGDLGAFAGLMDAPVETYLAPDVDHILRRTTGSGSPTAYRRETRQPLASDVVDRVVGWVSARVG